MATYSCFLAVSLIQILNIYKGERGELGLSDNALLYPGKINSFLFKRSYGRKI